MSLVQAIVYSKVTGRVRRVVDPQSAVPNVIAFLAQAGAGAGEAVMVYTKLGNGADSLLSWQAAVSAHTGLVPSPLSPEALSAAQSAATLALRTLTTVNDRYCVINAQNAIVGAMCCDPSCGDSVPGCTLVASQVADVSWTFTPPNTFMPPPPVVKP